MGFSVEQQSSGQSLSGARPRSRPHRTASLGSWSSGRRVDRASMFVRSKRSLVGGSAAQQSQAWLGIIHCINATVGKSLRLSAQPDVRADVRLSAGRDSTARCAFDRRRVESKLRGQFGGTAKRC